VGGAVSDRDSLWDANHLRESHYDQFKIPKREAKVTIAYFN